MLERGGEKVYKVFGEKVAGLDYKRERVYAVIFTIARDKVLTVQNSRGIIFYLVGNGK